MFVHRSPKVGVRVIGRGHADAMADLFAIVGLVAVGLLTLARWWEEH